MNITKAWHDSFDVITDLVSLHDKNLKVVKVNKAFADTFNISQKEAAGKQCYELIHKTAGACSGCPFEEVLVSRKAVAREIYVPRLKLYMEVTAYPLFSDGKDDIEGILHFVKDITEHKQTKEKLLVTHFAVEYATDGICWIGPDASFRYVNDAMCRNLGYSREELLTMTVLDVDPVIRKKHWASHWQETKLHKHRIMETAHLAKDGEVMPVEVAINHLTFGGEEFHCTFVRNIAERKRMEGMLRESEEKFRNIYSQSPIGIELYNADGFLIEANKACLDMFGISDIDEIVGFNLFKDPNLPPDAAERVSNGEAIAYEAEFDFDIVREKRLYATSKTGKCHLDCLITPLKRETDAPAGYLVHVRDITKRKHAEEALKAVVMKVEEEKRKSEAVIAAIGDAVSIQDTEYRILYQNRASKDIYGDHIGEYCYRAYQNRDHVCGRCHLTIAFRDGIVNTMEQSRKTDKGVSYYEITASPLRDSGNRIIAGIEVVRDVTERKKMEEQIKHQAHYDFLTDLPNRKLFLDHLNLALAQARRSRHIAAVMFLDLDRFKNINDTLGHSAGDHLLKEIAKEVKMCVRESDTVSRIGGDEFAILLPQMAHTEDAATIAKKVLSTFKRAYYIDGQELHITPSIGISIYPTDGNHAETLLKHADIAMYHAKEQGRNNYQFYNPAINLRSLEKMILENSLRKTLQRGELELHYQTQVDAVTGEATCAEALVRWRHPELGLLDPKQFIPLAEEIGLIVPIDEWVLRTACAQNKAWQQEGYPPLCVTVNISAYKFQQSDFLERVSHVIGETGLEPRFLELEITESTAMQNMELIVPKMVKLSEMGIRFAVDDFGTGYSSLSCLKKLPVQKLKIDKAFINALERDADYEAIVNAVIAMAHSLNLEVVAEGVETAGQLAFLRSVGCDGIQGHIMSEPLPAEEFKKIALQRFS